MKRWYMRRYRQEQNWSSTFEALAGTLAEAGSFVLRLLFDQRFRRELLDPFRQKSLFAPATELGVILIKEHYDDHVFLQMMTSRHGALSTIQEVLERHGIVFETKPMDQRY